jgi:hypothetical protein
MSIYKYKECDVCKFRRQLEPLLIGGAGTDWIEVTLTSELGFIVTRHFCSTECLQFYTRQKAKREEG